MNIHGAGVIRPNTGSTGLVPANQTVRALLACWIEQGEFAILFHPGHFGRQLQCGKHLRMKQAPGTVREEYESRLIAHLTGHGGKKRRNVDDVAIPSLEHVVGVLVLVSLLVLALNRVKVDLSDLLSARVELA